MSRVLRFGAGSLVELPDVLAEAGIGRAVLVTTRRGAAAAPDLPVAAVYDGVEPHVPVETVREAAALAVRVGADGLVALGGGSAVDTAKAVVVEALAHDCHVRVVAVPTTYAGAEWTSFFGMLLAPGEKSGGSDERARPVAAIYDPLLTLDLPLAGTVGTAMNALAHCAEAYYAAGASDAGMRHADTGATAISYALPLVVERPREIYARTRLLEGAMRAAFALEEAGLAFGHALAQALGGRFGLPQGTMNAICLPAALRFNAVAVPDAVARFAAAMHVPDAAVRCEQLAGLGGFGRLRDQGVPESELPAVAEAAAARPGSARNPRVVTAADALVVLRTIW